MVSLRKLVFYGVLALTPVFVHGQTVDDEIMMPRRTLCTGFSYSHDRWDEYWEGTRKRGNDNIGALTTSSVAWMGSYGVTDRLNVIAMLPYVTTKASLGTLRGMSGFQDVTLAAKYNLLDTAFTTRGTVRAIVVGTVGAPVSDYTSDFYPLSIGSASPRAGARFTLSFRETHGFFVSASGARTWRGNVALDRPAYYTDGRLFLSDQVAMPDVFDYTISGGYRGKRLSVPLSFSQQRTLGGGDIRRQDMPFVSNRMNYSKIDGTAMYHLVQPKNVSVKAGATYTVGGRNVGQSTTLTAGLLYTFRF